jgi:hypothetical protein
MTSTILTEALIMASLDTLSHGGTQATSLFMEMSKRLHERGEMDGLQDWITIAAPALPEKERNEVIVMLMHSHLFLAHQTQAHMGSERIPPSLH